MPLLLEYGWVLLVLIALEGILAADNAVVLAMIVRHLPENERKKALFYGLAGAFLFRIISLFFIPEDELSRRSIAPFYGNCTKKNDNKKV